MKRIVKMLIAAAFIAAPLAAITSPASATASAEVCAGQGTVTLSEGIYYPAPLGAAARTVTATVNLGSCQRVTKAGPIATGSASGTVTLTGNCGRSFGAGNINGGRLEYESAGSVLVIGDSPTQTGTSVWTGTANAVPVTPGESCLGPETPGGGADRFTVTGAIERP